jgi:hypothetical protein
VSRLALTSVFAAITALLCLSAVNALTVVPLSDEQLAKKAEIIVVGRVLSAHYEVDTKDKRPYTFIHVQVTETLKGKNVSRELTLKTLGGIGPKMGMQVPGAADFYRNEETLLFLERRSDGSLLPIGLSIGKYPIYRELESGKKIVIRQMGGNGKYFSEPRESNVRDVQADQKMYLDDFRGRIRHFIER